MMGLAVSPGGTTLLHRRCHWVLLPQRTQRHELRWLYHVQVAQELCVMWVLDVLGCAVTLSQSPGGE